MRELGRSQRHPYSLHKVQKASQSPQSEPSIGIPTPPLCNEQRRSSIHTNSTDRLEDEDYWHHRQRILRPNSPRRYYRPEKRKSPSGEKNGKDKEKPPRKRRNKKLERRRKKEEGRLTRPSTTELLSSVPNTSAENAVDLSLLEAAVVSEIS